MDLMQFELPETVGAALMVLMGLYGIDPERRKKLTADGYNAAQVQLCVNDLLKLFKKYGG